MVPGLLVAACAERVRVPDNDTTPPTVEIRAVSRGQQIGQASSQADQPTNARVLAGRRVGLLVSGRDAGGVSSLEIRAASGGRLRDSTGGAPQRAIEKSGAPDAPVDRLTIGTAPVFAEPGSSLRLVARAQDVSANMAETPVLVLERVSPTEPDLRVEPNPILRGRQATLSWSLPGGNVAAATITDGDGTVVVPNAHLESDPTALVDPVQDTTYVLTIDTKVAQTPVPVEDTVRLQVPEPLVELTASRSPVAPGQVVEFRYRAQGVERVEIPGLLDAPVANFPGTVDSGPLNETTTYTATGFIGPNAAASDSARVAVELPDTVELRLDTTEQLSACGPTTSGFELDTQDVTKPFGVYATVEKVELPGVDPTEEFVNIYYGPPSVNHPDRTKVGSGTGATGRTMTDFFDARDVRDLWCFQWQSPYHDAFEGMEVVFTLAR
jgi:hypothetical protein